MYEFGAGGVTIQPITGINSNSKIFTHGNQENVIYMKKLERVAVMEGK